MIEMILLPIWALAAAGTIPIQDAADAEQQLRKAAYLSGNDIERTLIGLIDAAYDRSRV
jgi:hypothetical protein